MVTDEDTIFATLIMQSAAVPEVELYPRPLMRWSEKLYQHVFRPYGQFSLQENGEPFTLDFSVDAWLSCRMCRVADNADMFDKPADTSQACMHFTVCEQVIQLPMTLIGV